MNPFDGGPNFQGLGQHLLYFAGTAQMVGQASDQARINPLPSMKVSSRVSRASMVKDGRTTSASITRTNEVATAGGTKCGDSTAGIAAVTAVGRRKNTAAHLLLHVPPKGRFRRALTERYRRAAGPPPLGLRQPGCVSGHRRFWGERMPIGQGEEPATQLPPLPSASLCAINRLLVHPRPAQP